jgi:hypothetical protein
MQLILLYTVDTKFKTFRIMFIFYFNIVFIKHFLKMALARVHFTPGFPPGAGFPIEHVFRKFFKLRSYTMILYLQASPISWDYPFK